MGTPPILRAFLIIAAFSALMACIAVGCANRIEDEYPPYTPTPVEEVERVVVTVPPPLPTLEAPTNTPTPVPFATQTPDATPELYTLTAAQIRSIVFENTMFLYQEGLIPKPTQMHAIVACSHWDEPGANYPESHWIGVMQRAADEGKNDLLPTIAIVKTLDYLSEHGSYENAYAAVAQYCHHVQAEAN